jgi:hypothetical protein
VSALEFCGFASQPGNGLGECWDAAGVDASVCQLRLAELDEAVAYRNDTGAGAAGPGT